MISDKVVEVLGEHPQEEVVAEAETALAEAQLPQI